MNEIVRKYYKTIDEEMYIKKLDNGLTIFINKKTGFNKIYSSLTVNFGAYDTKFIPFDEEDYIEVPYGVAHFLEHKMFEMPDGIDASNLFEALGADSNAYTDWNTTSYIATTINNFDEVITLLLDFVQTPYFTYENVEKEKGIIIEELKMYKDKPSDKIFKNLMRNMYKYNGRVEDVVGNINSINSINKDILYKCYNTFYHPSNMYLCIAGDIDVDKTITLIEENQKNKTFSLFKPIKCKYILEDCKVYKKSGSSKTNIATPRVSLAVKYPILKFEKNELLKNEILCKIFLEYMFGFSSNNYQYMLDNDLISDILYVYVSDKCSSYLKFDAISCKPKQFVKYIKKELLNLKNVKYDEMFLNNIKKGLLGYYIKSFDSVDFIGGEFVDYKLKNCDLFDAIEIINNITSDDIIKFCEYINEESISYYILNPR